MKDLILDYRFNKKVAADLAEEIKNNKEIKKLQILHYKIWIKYFILCQTNPHLFITDPLLIEFKYEEIIKLSQYFERNDWPEIFEVKEEINKLVKETKKTRTNIFNKYYTTSYQ